jgi:hypothetical protein
MVLYIFLNVVLMNARNAQGTAIFTEGKTVGIGWYQCDDVYSVQAALQVMQYLVGLRDSP